MNVPELKHFCRGFPHAIETLYGDPYNFLVYSVGRKKFAYFKTSRPERWRFSTRVAPHRFIELTDIPGVKPARYRGRFHWITIVHVAAFPAAYLKALVDWSYENARGSSSKARRPLRAEARTTLTLRAALPDDAEDIARLLTGVRMLFMRYAPSAHSDEEILSWVRTSLVASGDTVVGRIGDQCVGVMAMAKHDQCWWITQMAVDPSYVNLRIGSTLLAYAIRMLPPPIRLYTFQANAGARRFYERHGFRAIEFSDGRANAERCPDVLYEFTGR